MTLLAALVLAQGSVPLADLAFDHGDGHIWLKGSLNGKPASVVLDTGASLTVVDETAALAAGATKGDAVAVAANGPATVSAWQAKGLSVSLDGTTITQPAALALPLVASMAGYVPSHPLEVILGADFLRRYVAEIDYVRSRVRLFDPQGYRPPVGSAALPVRYVNDRPVVEGSLRVAGKTLDKVSMLIDTGTGLTLDLTNLLVLRTDIARRVKGETYQTLAGLGGWVDVRDAPGTRLRLGGVELKADARIVLTAEGASGAGAGYDAILGDGALSRLHLTMDLSRSTVYVRANGR